MDVGDLQFRVGLIAAVLVLGSVFAGALSLLLKEDGTDQARRIADSLGDVLSALCAGGRAGSARVDLSSSGDGIGLSPTIAGEHYSVHVLPSLIYISWSDGREVASRLRGILPSHPVLGGDPDADTISELMSSCRGYSVRTPCSLILDLTYVNGSAFVAIYPEGGALDGEISSLAGFFDDAAIPVPGHEDTLEAGPFEHCEVRDRVLLIGDPDHEGGCPYPLMVPPSFRVLVQGDVGGMRLSLSRSSVVMPDGGFDVVRTLTAC